MKCFRSPDPAKRHVHDSGLRRSIDSGDFTLLTETEMVLEQLNGINSDYGNYHGINLLPELKGQLPQNKAAMLATIDLYLHLDQQQNNFILGRRLNYYTGLGDLSDPQRYQQVASQMAALSEYPLEQLQLFHQLRARMI